MDLAGNEVEMGRVNTNGGSSGNPGGSKTGATTDNTIDYASIDNENYAYYVWLNLPTDTNNATVDAHGVTIGYTVNRPY